MKKLIFTLLSFCLLYGNSYAQYCGHNGTPSGPTQCTPDGSLTKPGLGPTSDSLAPVINGVVSTTVIQFKNYDTARYQGNLVTVQTLKIDSIGNLPAGLCWATNHTNNTYNNQEEGCIKVTGTTCSDPGVYKLFIRVGVDIGLGVAIPINAESVGLKYYVRVKNNGDADVALDTSQAVAFSKPAGYSANANCSGVGIQDLGNPMSELSVVPNPFTSKATVRFFSEKTMTVTERVTNMIGSEVYNKEIEVKAGENISTLDRGTLAPGIYFYTIGSERTFLTKRITISE